MPLVQAHLRLSWMSGMSRSLGDACEVERHLSSCKILRDATPKSFVILDGEPSQRIASYCIYLPIVELGRGTSTYVSRSLS